MANNNVLNRIEQPEDAAGEDNVYNLEGTVNVDVLNEFTSGAGVTIDGVLLKDGTVTKTGPDNIDVNTGISANAGGGVGSAVALTGQYNNVTTVATAADSVKLLTAVTGLIQEVKNSGANTLAVFPNTDDSINALAADLSIDILPGCTKRFIAISAVVWETQEVITLNAPTTQRGSLSLIPVDNAANHEIAISNVSHGQDSTYSIPDSGLSAASFVVSTNALTIAEADQNDLTGTVGTVAGTNISVVETGNQTLHKSVFTMAAHALTVTDTGANGAHGTQEFYTFPEGHVQVIGTHMDLTVFSAQGTGSADSGVFDVGVGSTAVDTDDETLETDEQDIVNKLEGTLDGSGDLAASVNGSLGTPAAYDGSATALTLNLNATITAATASATEIFDVTAVCTVFWILLGDD